MTLSVVPLSVDTQRAILATLSKDAQDSFVSATIRAIIPSPAHIHHELSASRAWVVAHASDHDASRWLPALASAINALESL